MHVSSPEEGESSQFSTEFADCRPQFGGLSYRYKKHKELLSYVVPSLARQDYSL